MEIRLRERFSLTSNKRFKNHWSSYVNYYITQFLKTFIYQKTRIVLFFRTHTRSYQKMIGDMLKDLDSFDSIENRK